MYKVKMFHSFGCFTIEWFYTLSVSGVVLVQNTQCMYKKFVDL